MTVLDLQREARRRDAEDGDSRPSTPQYSWATRNRSVVIPNVSWDTYCSLLEDMAHEHVRINYLKGWMEIMSPHVQLDPSGRVMFRLLDELTMMLEMDLVPVGGATYRSKPGAVGAEPDESYFVTNLDRIRAKIEEGGWWDAQTDPAPDLIMESENTNPVLPKLEIYASLGVREIWRHDKERLTVLVLRGEGYEEAATSELFPLLDMAEFYRFAKRLPLEGSRKVIPEFRQWVQGRIDAAKP